MTRHVVLTASILVTLAVAVPAYAQGKGKGNAKGLQNHAPSSSPLPSESLVAPPTTGALPVAWIDDATVLAPGTIVATLSIMHWNGAGIGETDAPIAGVSAGLTSRFQLGAMVPRVVPDSSTGIAGGAGTSFVSAKVGVLTGARSGVKLAVSPTLEILGSNSLQALAPGASRTQFGLPVAIEADRGAVRAFASAGFFTQSAWFAGGGAGFQATRRISVAAAITREWATSASGSATDRREVAGSVAFSPRPAFAVFGSVGHTVATLAQDGAGTTVSAGVMLLLASSMFK